MAVVIQYSEDQLRALLKKAYLDGVEDGDTVRPRSPQEAETMWLDSVTYDDIPHIIQKARNT